MTTYAELLKTLYNKKAAAVLTPEAEQAVASAGMPPAGQPGMPVQGAAPAGMPMPGAPMDPSMMQGAPAPQAAPVDPSMMAQGGMPAAQPVQDPMFLQFLMQVMGLQPDPNTGMIIDPSTGQPVPDDVLQQLYAEFQAQMAQQSAPVDPAAGMGDPAAAGMPGPEAAQPEAGIPSEITEAINAAIQSAVEANVAEPLARNEKLIAALMDKLDTIKSLLEEALGSTNTTDKDTEARTKELAAELEKELKAQADSGTEQVQAPLPVEALLSGSQAAPAAAPASQEDQLSLLAAMGGM